jgi:hypothetical protein
MKAIATLRALRRRLPRNTFFCLLSGIATYVPGLYRIFAETCTAEAARYCYAIWLRHLVAVSEEGLDADPHTIAELGPGNSLGPGLTAMLCGANRLFAFDVVDYSDVARNLAVFDQLVELIEHRASIPDDDEIPSLWPTLKSYGFPHHILTPERLGQSLRPERLEAIRAALRGDGLQGDIEIRYYCPWYDNTVIQKGTVDMVYSQFVLEHVDQLESTYSALALWLKPGGYCSHTIDFASHNLTEQWNGHWRFRDLTWRLIRGRKPYLLNRAPCATHLGLLAKNGLEAVSVNRKRQASRLVRENLAPRFRTISEDDLTTRVVHIIAQKR